MKKTYYNYLNNWKIVVLISCTWRNKLFSYNDNSATNNCSSYIGQSFLYCLQDNLWDIITEGSQYAFDRMEQAKASRGEDDTAEEITGFKHVLPPNIYFINI